MFSIKTKALLKGQEVSSALIWEVKGIKGEAKASTNPDTLKELRYAQLDAQLLSDEMAKEAAHL